MTIWKEAQLQRLTQGDDTQSIFEAALSLTYELGFEYCAFAISPHSLDDQSHAIRINNYPDEWNKKYEMYNYAAQDPIMKHCSHSVLPILWDDNVFSTFPTFWEEAQTYGLHHGWSQSVLDSRGFFSVLSLSRSHHPITQNELNEKAVQLMWLCHALHEVVAQKVLSDADFFRGPRLTIRETEVLKWSADGKTASDIATILCLSERTVNYHVSSAIKKMGVNNKISAVVRAARRGLL